MKLLEHSAQGATIQLNQRELLLIMALVQEGRESFGCNTNSGRALDELISQANVLVETARRDSLLDRLECPRISTVVNPQPGLSRDASNG